MSAEIDPGGPVRGADASPDRRRQDSRMRRLLNAVRRKPLMSGLVLTGPVEAITCFNRFVLGLRTKDHLDLLTTLTFGLRIHHGYVGLAMLVVWAACAGVRRLRDRWWHSWLLAGGIACVLSDAVHHFIVLKLVTGCTEFP